MTDKISFICRPFKILSQKDDIFTTKVLVAKTALSNFPTIEDSIEKIVAFVGKPELKVYYAVFHAILDTETRELSAGVYTKIELPTNKSNEMDQNKVLDESIMPFSM